MQIGKSLDRAVTSDHYVGEVDGPSPVAIAYQYRSGERLDRGHGPARQLYIRQPADEPGVEFPAGKAVIGASHDEPGLQPQVSAHRLHHRSVQGSDAGGQEGGEYELASRHRGAHNDGLPKDRPVDVVVVGGGIIGASLLHWLAASGLRVVLLERGELAAGASGRNAGFLLAGVASNYAQAIGTYGRERARALWELTRHNIAALAAVLAPHEVGYSQRGSWAVPVSSAELGELEESAQLLRDDGFNAVWDPRPPDYLRRYQASGLGTESAGGALLNPDDGELDAAAATRALAAAAVEAGQGRVTLQAGVRVMELDAGADSVQVRTAAGVVHPSRVILATNAYTSQVFDGAPIEPVRGQMLATAPLSTALAERPVYSNRGFRYWRQLSDGELLLGGWRDAAIEEEVGFEEAPTHDIQRRLDAHLQTFLGDGRVNRRWAGTMGFTRDRLPLVGPLPGREAILLCGGYSGHGLGLAFVAAELLARHLTEGAAVPSWLLPARFLAAE